jgi:O-antigen ligase
VSFLSTRGSLVSRRAPIALTAAAVVAPLVMLPLLVQPQLGIGAATAAIGLLLAWMSPAYPLGLSHSRDLVPLAGGELPPGAVTKLLFAWLLAGIVFAVFRRADRVPGHLLFIVPVLLSLALFAVMLLRLPDSAAGVYASDKAQLFLTVNIAVLLGGVIVGRNPRDVELCLALMLAVAVVASFALLLQILNGVEPTYEGRYAVSNRDYDPIALGRVTAGGILIALYALLSGRTGLRIVALAVAPLLTVAFLASGGRGPVVGLVAGLVVLLSLPAAGARRRRLMVLGVVVLSVALASQIVPGDAMDRAASVIVGGSGGLDSNGRTELWAQAWSLFAENPWLGIGTGGFAAVSPLEVYPHNLVLEVAAEFGLLGLVPLVLALIAGVVAIARSVRAPLATDRGLSVLVAALFTAALVNAMFSTDITANSDVWLLLGLGVGLASRVPAGRPASWRTA